jgi:hypothetical protein
MRGKDFLRFSCFVQWLLVEQETTDNKKDRETIIIPRSPKPDRYRNMSHERIHRTHLRVHLSSPLLPPRFGLALRPRPASRFDGSHPPPPP